MNYLDANIEKNLVLNQLYIMAILKYMIVQSVAIHIHPKNITNSSLTLAVNDVLVVTHVWSRASRLWCSLWNNNFLMLYIAALRRSLRTITLSRVLLLFLHLLLGAGVCIDQNVRITDCTLNSINNTSIRRIRAESCP